MSATHDPPPIEHLLAHRAWVRDLARRLSRDEADADDLEQDVWLSAARTPPRAGDGLRAWLATVLRNRSRERYRGDVHRGERESRAARPEASPGGAAIVAEAEAHGRVVQAVLALDEPYRETVLLRFFEGLPPREVAARMGVPSDTVRTRLRRAAATLRERLGGRREDWLGALAPLLAVGRDASPPLSVAGGIAMQASSKVALIAAAVLLAGALGTWRVAFDGGAGAAGDGETATVESEASAGEDRHVSAGPGPRRRAAAAEPAASATASDETHRQPPQPPSSATKTGPHGRVTGRILLADGRPAAGVAVGMPVADRGFATGWSTTDADGRYAMDVPAADAERAVWVISTGHRAGSPGVFRVTDGAALDAGELRLESDGDVVLRGSVRSSTGAAIDSGTVTLSSPLSDDDVAKSVGQREAAPALMLAAMPRRAGEPQAVAQLRDLRADVGTGGRFEMRLPASFGAVFVRVSAPGHAPGWQGPLHPMDCADRELEFLLQPLPRMRGQVVDAKTLAPLAGARVGFVPQRAGATVLTDTEGRFDVTAQAGQQLPLHVLLEGCFGEYAHPAPDDAPVTVKLWRVTRIEGRVILVGGKPVAGVHVVAALPANLQGGTGAGGTATTGGDGGFVFESLREGIYELQATCVDGSSASFSPRAVPGVASGRDDVVLCVEEAPTITGRVIDPEGRPVAGIHVSARVGGVWAGGGTSGADGVVRLVGVRPEPSTLVVRDPEGSAGGYLDRTIDGVAAGTSGLDIVVQKGLAITGRIVDEDGRPVARRGVVVTDAASNPFEPGARRCTTDADGRFTAGGLTSGAWRLQLDGTESNWTRMWLAGGESVAAGTSGVKLSVTSGGVISGVLLDAAGAPLARERVDALWDPKMHAGRIVLTDDRGRFEFANLPPGRAYTVVSRHGRVADVALGTRDLRLAP